MKRLSIYLLIIALAATSCRKEAVVTSGRAVISFAVPHVEQTKSVLITDVTGMKSGDNELAFSVFASRYIPGTNGTVTSHEQFMDDVKVRSTDNGVNWTYDGEYYWSPGACHKFFAVYPFYDKTEGADIYDLGLSFAIDEVNHAVRMTGIHAENTDGAEHKIICTGTEIDPSTQTCKNICTDILYGVKTYDIPYSAGEDRGPIEFQMNHALAAVSFRLRNASEYAISNIAAEPVTGFKNGAEYVLLSERGPEWKGLRDISEHSFTVPSVTDEIDAGAYYEPAGNRYWYTALMIPQNFASYSDPKFSFEVRINSETKSYTLNFKSHPVSDLAQHAYEFLPGHHYIYNLNITAQKITCDVEIVPWIDDELIELN